MGKDEKIIKTYLGRDVLPLSRSHDQVEYARPNVCQSEVAKRKKCISIEIAEYVYEVKFGETTILYAPILHEARIRDPKIESYVNEASVVEMSARSCEIVRNGEAHMLRPVSSPYDMDNMVILPNFKCNFKCSYCYSAQGRSDEEIDIKSLDSALDWFLDKDRIPESDLTIFIVGGGEPVMSWEAVEEIVGKVAESRKIRKRGIALAMTTNGSLITEERARFLALSDVMVNVSYEVIREVQNRQRGMCDAVERGIEALQRAGAKFAIRATVSPLSVDRMTEMVDIVLRRFPRVRRLNLEAILAGKEVFATEEALRSFLKRFRDGFGKAREKGNDKGLKVITAAQMDLTILKERFCRGDFCLTPRGDITICRRFSSEREKNFSHMVFGHIENGHMKIDEVAYRIALEAFHNDRDQCRQCFLRWHCGGLCMSQQTMFPPEYHEVLCDFSRETYFDCLKEFATGRDSKGRASPLTTSVRNGTVG